MVAHFAAVAVILVLAAQIIEGTGWILLLPALAALFVVWFGQAIHAHRRAVAMGARPGGELHVALLLPVIAAVMTVYWIAGGDGGSPASTLREYVLAWQSERSAHAAELLVEPVPPDVLAAEWRADEAYLVGRVALATSQFGTASGLDPAQPFDSLRFTELTAERRPDTAVVAIDIVRRQRVETTILGIIPTAAQQTVSVERVGQVVLRSAPAAPPAWMPFRVVEAAVWRVAEVDLPVGLGPP